MATRPNAYFARKPFGVSKNAPHPALFQKRLGLLFAIDACDIDHGAIIDDLRSQLDMINPLSRKEADANRRKVLSAAIASAEQRRALCRAH